MSRKVGPKPNSAVSHQAAAVWRGSALITTLFYSRSLESAAVSAKDGMSVENRSALREPFPVGG